MKFSRISVWWLLLGLLVLGVSGCTTTADSENSSTRPWNAQRGWENGIPGLDRMH